MRTNRVEGRNEGEFIVSAQTRQMCSTAQRSNDRSRAKVARAREVTRPFYSTGQHRNHSCALAHHTHGRTFTSPVACEGNALSNTLLFLYRTMQLLNAYTASRVTRTSPSSPRSHSRRICPNAIAILNLFVQHYFRTTPEKEYPQRKIRQPSHRAQQHKETFKQVQNG